MCIAMSTLGYCCALLLLLRWQCPVLIREVSCGVIAPSHIAVQSTAPRLLTSVRPPVHKAPPTSYIATNNNI